jgi:nitrogen fixation protein NifQ
LPPDAGSWPPPAAAPDADASDAAAPDADASAVRAWLVQAGSGDPFDRHVFASVLAIAGSEAGRRLTDATGLGVADLVRLFQTCFPHAGGWLAARLATAAPPDPALADAIEEADLVRLLLDHGTDRAAPSTAWLAAMIARRSLGANHLWQDLGLDSRGELSRLMRRHFRPLADANDRDMKWKKFFYRRLCQLDGVLVCKAPNCGVCSDRAHCFGDEAGDPLIRLGRDPA